MSDEFDINTDPAKLPALPSLDGVQDPTVKKFLQAVKESIEIRTGQRPRTNKLDQALTFRDLYNYGLASFKINGQEVVNTNPDPAVNAPGTSAGSGSGNSSDDLTIPGAPSGLVATGTKLSVLLEWDPSATDIGYTEVWRSEANNLATAVMVGATEATIYADIINSAGVTYYYWIRFVNRGGIAGNYNDDIGTAATTGQIGSAEILSMDGAKIIDATILNAKISSVSADKIITGVLNATESISVGDATSRIHISGSGRIRSGGATDYMNGSGFYFDNPEGFGRAFIGNGTYYVAWSGSQLTIEGNNFSLTPTSFTFNGSGTFAGALNAATGTFAGELQAATGTFSGALSAATGTFAGNLMAGVLDFSQLDGVRQAYLSPGTYTFTVPAGKTDLRITSCGGTGGGGGGGSAFTTSGGGGGGGGTNATTVTIKNTLVAGDVLTIVVGGRGNGGARNTAGTSGAASSVSKGSTVYVSSNGGGGGQPGTNQVNAGTNPGGAGGAGGNGGGNGQNGGAGYAYTTNPGTLYYGTAYVGGTGGAGGTSSNGGRAGGRGGDGGSYSTEGANGSDGFVLIESFNPNSVVLQTTYNELISTLTSKGYLP